MELPDVYIALYHLPDSDPRASCPLVESGLVTTVVGQDSQFEACYTGFEELELTMEEK